MASQCIVSGFPIVKKTKMNGKHKVLVELKDMPVAMQVVFVIERRHTYLPVDTATQTLSSGLYGRSPYQLQHMDLCQGFQKLVQLSDYVMLDNTQYPEKKLKDNKLF